MNILITGVHGFVGSNLVEALNYNNTIYGLDIVSPVKEGVACTYSWEDLDSGLIPEVDAIIHLAGKAHDTKNSTQADIYFQVNTLLTQKIYDYFLNSKIGKFIFFSTVKAAADRVEGEFLTENITPMPVGPYGESKIKAEDYILAHSAGVDQQTYIFRPCMIHGPGNKGNLNLLYQVVNSGIPWPLGAFENRRTFTSIDNLCFIVNNFLEGDIESGIYHIGDDESLSTNELIESMCEAMGRKARIWRIPISIMTLIANIGTYCYLPLNKDRLQKLTENYVVCNDKVKRAIGVDRLPCSAKEGVVKTIKSFKYR